MLNKKKWFESVFYNFAIRNEYGINAAEAILKEKVDPALSIKKMSNSFAIMYDNAPYALFMGNGIGIMYANQKISQEVYSIA